MGINHLRQPAVSLLVSVPASQKNRDARSVAGCTGYRGAAISIADMNDAIHRGLVKGTDKSAARRKSGR